MGIFDIIAGPLLKIVDKIIPDPAAKAAAQLEIIKLQNSTEMAELDANVKMATAQSDTNKIEAAGTNWFRAGWRPFIGWVGGLGLFYQFLLQPLMEWFSLTHGWHAPPKLDLHDLTAIITGMLGLGALRTTEKIKGAD